MSYDMLPKKLQEKISLRLSREDREKATPERLWEALLYIEGVERGAQDLHEAHVAIFGSPAWSKPREVKTALTLSSGKQVTITHTVIDHIAPNGQVDYQKLERSVITDQLTVAEANEIMLGKERP